MTHNNQRLMNSSFLTTRLLATAWVVLSLFLIHPQRSLAQALRVSDNKRFLVRSDGTPFFWLGDTAWELFHRLTREETEQYLKKRAEQGFTVIQAVVLAELDGLNAPTPEGYRPLNGNDPAQPNADYFKKVDDVIDLAGKYGLFIGLLPTWGDKVNGDRGGAIFNPQNAQTYGRFLGERYKNRTNVIWILGGDRAVDKPELLAVWRAMAAGVTEGIGGASRGVFTFHPRGGRSSSTEFHQDAWLDLNMQQTGHCRGAFEHETIASDYALSPAKPVVNGEPIYEDHPVCFNVKDMGHSNAYDVRRAAYLSVFAGACGHTYGCHSIWQAYAPGRTPINVPLKPWNESLELTGANQLRHLRALMESRPVLDRVPNQALLADSPRSAESIQATQGKDYLFVYTATGLPFSVQLGKISGQQLVGTWYNPRTGESKSIGTFDNVGRHVFTPPRVIRDGLDWVLILDDAAKRYPLPVVKN
jgi:hypothetical protein